MEEDKVDSMEGTIDSDEGTDRFNEEDDLGNYGFEGIEIDGRGDLTDLDADLITDEVMMKFHFSNIECAFQFYNWFGKRRGFSARRGKERKDKNEEIVEKTFFCHREGKRRKRKCVKGVRKSKPETRNGCLAKLKIRVLKQTGRWHVTSFCNEHNHPLVLPKFTKVLPAHRRMTDADIMQMNNMRKAGISTPQIYGSFASQCGGFEHVGFSKRDMYNQIVKQRSFRESDVKSALQYLRKIAEIDEALACRHTVDEKGRLQRLFWCDGHSQVDYKLFGDVLAFDATYQRNKYHYPLVVFSGINHHNQSIIFATTLVGDETEETYVWLLQQFLVVMKGKCPTAVITDGDVAMRNAIRRVFPNASHRLCAWHLIRNATSNVKNPKVVAEFKRCMLGDYELHQFHRKWETMVRDFGLEDNSWVKEIFEKRRMWATAYMRARFFGGFRMTSRCEGLHSHIGKFVHSRHDLADFLENFRHCLDAFRYRELEADFASVNGEPIMQTNIKVLEKSACRSFTWEVFTLFLPALARGSTVRVKSSTTLMSQTIFTVTKYGRAGNEWHVSWMPNPFQIRCSCKRMESFGLPCDHIVGVLVHLNIEEMPKCLVLDRWTMGIKEKIHECNVDQNTVWDSVYLARCGALDWLCRLMTRKCARSTMKYNVTRDLVTRHLQWLGESDEGIGDENEKPEEREIIRDPVRVGSKGCAATSTSQPLKSRKRQRCRLCGEVGHNRTTCSTIRRQYEHVLSQQEPFDEAVSLAEDCLSF
ncbi:Zinc finger, PMZ-type [Sesbania bispinosa]|nr:Zinc finger, PMZ-type [Sesbania bispinosa]